MFIYITFPKINEVPGQYCWTIRHSSNKEFSGYQSFGLLRSPGHSYNHIFQTLQFPLFTVHEINAENM
jgi:hypothetical protein